MPSSILKPSGPPCNDDKKLGQPRVPGVEI